MKLCVSINLKPANDEFYTFQLKAAMGKIERRDRKPGTAPFLLKFMAFSLQMS